MKALRKTFGVLIIIFIAMPILLGVIWAVGLTRAVVSPKFLVEMPKEIIAKVPDMMEEVLTEVDREDMVCDPNNRAWVRAFARAKTSPKDLLSKIGVLDWLENELTVSLEQLGKMMRGEIPAKRIDLNMIPLKQALKSPEIKNYLMEVMKDLPPCNESELEKWRAAAENPRDIEHLPACRPVDLESAPAAIDFVSEREVNEIPDSVHLVNMTDDFHTRFPRHINPFRVITPVLLLLFIIPGFFIMIAALLGGTERGGFLKWMGVTLIIGALLSYGLAFLLKNSIPWGMTFAHEHTHFSAFEEMMIGKANTLGMVIIDHLVYGVFKVSGGVALVGLAFFAFSFLRSSRGEENTPQPPRQTNSQPPQPPQPPQPANTSGNGEPLPVHTNNPVSAPIDQKP